MRWYDREGKLSIQRWVMQKAWNTLPGGSDLLDFILTERNFLHLKDSNNKLKDQKKEPLTLNLGD